MENQKHLFSLREDLHYLNCAYKGPLLKTAEAAAMQSLERDKNPVDIKAEDYFETVEEVKHLFGSLVNCKASDVALIPSSSYGFASVLKNVACRKGQHAITIENEFPSDYFSIRRWCDKNNAALKSIRPDDGAALQGASWNNNIVNAINKDTAVVIISSVHWMSGLKFDLERIGKRCKEVGAKFIIDGTQSVGAMPMDVKKFHIDALVCAAYKWLFGPYSTGVAYIGECFQNGEPLEESWMNRSNARDFANLTDYAHEYSEGAGRFNVGQTSNFILLPMLKAGLKQLHEWKVSEIQLYCERLIKPLLVYLDGIGVELEDKAYFSNHLFALRLPKELDIELLKEKMAKYNISVSLRGTSIRVAVNVFNTADDIDALIAAIEETRNEL